jgi:predicted ATP-dependent protease
MREACFWGRKDCADMITDEHITKAIEEKKYRSNLLQQRIQDLIEQGTILIDTEDEKIGQVNGLSIIDISDYQFGRPNRITAAVAPGKEGVIDIEREAKLGGPIHSKGVLIISGYLSNTFSLGKPLSLAARLVFEQSYQGVEGDSASQAELYVLLSILSELPIKQSIAVTGSVNQIGEVQAIGGVNSKIEGYFEVCKMRGLDGEQGVIIPQSNVQNLMLKKEVTDAVNNGKFSIWAVSHVNEGIEILTGVEAGERNGDGQFPDNTVNRKVEEKLNSYRMAMREMREFI